MSPKILLFILDLEEKSEARTTNKTNYTIWY